MPKMTAPTSAALEFVDVVYADRAWLQAEFEAIVAANFPNPPPGDRSRSGGSAPAIGIPARRSWSGVGHHDPGSLTYAIEGLRRQRSPPH
jgi:hypothetical protein